MPKQDPVCQHTTIQLGPSACAARVGFELVSASEALGAAELLGESVDLDTDTEEAVAQTLSGLFPAPLILPGDELADEPGEEGQSCREWFEEEERNKPTTKRGTLYVASVPRIDPGLEHVGTWTRLDVKGTRVASGDRSTQPPRANDIIDYLRAFYHGVPVKPLPQQLSFVKWDGEEDSGDIRNGTSYIGLATKDNCTRVRARPSPDRIYPKQLNLEDILDAAIEMLPRDAYAVLLLVDHDLYEDDEDDFCCGRAYGGSRVCVVQTARYHPALDGHAGIDRAHLWPASHCKAYLDRLCRMEGIAVSRAVRGAAVTTTGSGSSSGPRPMRLVVDAAVKAATNTSVVPSSVAATPDTAQDQDQHQHQHDLYMQGLWLSRLARTTAHELGHCFGLDHCVYYACLMQSTASIAEDVRQPPYLCPVCLNKVAHAIEGELLGGGGGRAEHRRKKTAGPNTRKRGASQISSTQPATPAKTEARMEYLIQRYTAIAECCEKWASVDMFAGYQAWALARITALRGNS